MRNMRKETEEEYLEAIGAHQRDDRVLKLYFPDPCSTIIFTKNSVGRCIANNTSYNLQLKTHQRLESSYPGVPLPLSIASLGQEIKGAKTHS